MNMQWLQYSNQSHPSLSVSADENYIREFGGSKYWYLYDMDEMDMEMYEKYPDKAMHQENWAAAVRLDEHGDIYIIIDAIEGYEEGEWHMAPDSIETPEEAMSWCVALLATATS